MSAKVRARHDGADLRRLDVLGIVAMEWRRPPARSSGTVIIDSDDTANATLEDIVKGLAIVGISARFHGGGATAAALADTVVLRFGAVGMAAPSSDDTALLLPPINALRGNAAAKRQVWSQMRALLRR